MIALHTRTAKVQIVRPMLADVPVQRPLSGDVTAEPFALGHNLQVPFSNRISHGSFRSLRVDQNVPGNLPGKTRLCHGDDGRRQRRQIDSRNYLAKQLSSDGEISPVRDAARVTCRFTDCDPLPPPDGWNGLGCTGWTGQKSGRCSSKAGSARPDTNTAMACNSVTPPQTSKVQP